MSKRYTNEEKEYLIDRAIEAIQSLNGDYPSFKNYVWSVQHILKGGKINNNLDALVSKKLKARRLI